MAIETVEVAEPSSPLGADGSMPKPTEAESIADVSLSKFLLAEKEAQDQEPYKPQIVADEIQQVSEQVQ